MKEQERK